MAREAGKYVVLEGGEATGKTTQAQRLVGRLATEGISAVYMREPGSTPFAQAVREVLLSKTERNTRANVLAFNAARATMMDEVREKLDGGIWVVSDRNFTSTLVYQGIAEGEDVEGIRQVCVYASNGTFPDLTVILDIPVDVARQRLAARGGGNDYFESKPPEFHELVRQGYIGRQMYEGCVLVGGGGTEDEVEEIVWQVLDMSLLRDEDVPGWHRREYQTQWAAGQLAVNLGGGE